MRVSYTQIPLENSHEKVAMENRNEGHAQTYPPPAKGKAEVASCASFSPKFILRAPSLARLDLHVLLL